MKPDPEVVRGTEAKEQRPQLVRKEHKMVGTSEEEAAMVSQADLISLIREELVALKSTFKSELQKHISEAFKPLSDKMEALTIAVTKVPQKAEKAP